MLKKLILAAAGLALAFPAFADRGHRHGHDRHSHRAHAHAHWKHAHHRPHARRVLVVPPRVIYTPPPRVVYAPPPVVHYPRPPVGGVSIRLHFPL